MFQRLLDNMKRDNSQQYKIVMLVMSLVIFILALTMLFLVKEIRERQIYTTGRIDFINNYCLE